MMTLRKILLLTLMLIPLSACAGSDAPAAAASEQSKPSVKDLTASSVQPSEAKAELQRVYDQMQQITSSSQCNVDTDCAVIAVGNKSCGGPSHYMPYAKSVGAESIQQLQSLAGRSATLAEQVNKMSGMMSTCVMVEPPQVVCQQQRCATVDSRLSVGSGESSEDR